jgi:hypothetical protein
MTGAAHVGESLALVGDASADVALRAPTPLTFAAVFAATVAVWPGAAAAQGAGDFVFTDAEGHLVLRFAGAEASGLDASQFEEIANVELSTMVHDRLRADAVFEVEPVDSTWAESMAARVAEHVRQAGSEFSEVHVECRSASCRLVLDHPSTWSVEAHRALMRVAQRIVQAFIEANPATFEPVFLIAAHYQEPERPYMKLFLRRAAGRRR